MKQIPGSFFLTSIILSTALFACVPARQVEELKANYAKCQTERDAMASEKKQFETEYTELKAGADKMKKQLEGLVSDTTVIGTALRRMQRQYDKINKLNNQLLKKQAQLQQGSEAENRKLMEELQALKEELQKREDELGTKEKNLNKLNADLKERERRLNELEALISQKDAKLSELKDKISNALKGFEGKGLTIEERNGRIYVSMEAQLLFAKGSMAIDQKGKKMLIELAKALEGQPDLHILVEGHTDTDKITSSSIPRNNWELSVLRATAVVNIMTKNSSIEPERLTSAGRGEFIPVDSGSDEEAKSKNRRIEVILTPNLDALYKILEN